MIKYRAERVDGKGKVEGSPFDSNYSIYLTMVTNITDEDFDTCLVNPSTLEIFLFGKWMLVSELETKYKIVEKSEYLMWKSRFTTITED